ncbi:NPCBM/NEW2 domain-containing protein [Amycolatopsis dongchuanensis]|uniref:SEFIR domain-containing protein n=1 Tax=Amycolatopsis dongchuanensis TaxID=1070866 RepID=A0ABP9QUJ4_9PSEU
MADGQAPPDEGRGSQYEAAILRDNLTRNLRAETQRVLPVVLPGRSVEDIPAFLMAYSTTRFEIPEISVRGVAGLLAAITGQGPYPMPERGEWRGGAADDPLSPGTPWVAHSTGVHRAGVLLDGVRYDNSIVFRPREPGGTGFVELALDASYGRFTAVAGVPDDAAEPFQVGRFRVLLDGRPRAETTATLGKPVPVELDVTGTLRLRLEMHRPPALAGSHPAELAWGDPLLV